MPINIPNDLPAKEILESEKIFAIDDRDASKQDIRPLKLVILNLMPKKIETETQILRLISKSPLQVDIDFMMVKNHESKNTSHDHLLKFYDYFEHLKENCYDGMIITGAPVEHLAFEEVDYWEELEEIMEWSKTHVTSTLYICWAAQAGLYYHYGIKKHILNKKISGVYEHHPLHNKLPIIRGFDDKFYVPHSRNTGVDGEAIRKNKELTIVAESDETGPYIILNSTGSQVFVTGHPEYDVLTLDGEYKRDLAKGMDNVPFPNRYYKDDKPELGPVKSWRCHANTLYTNWLNYYVYQMTTYDPMEIQNLK